MQTCDYRDPYSSGSLESQCQPDRRATQPRLRAPTNCGRAWPVAVDCAPDYESDPRICEKTVADPRNTIISVCDELKAFLLSKNDSYGSSAFEPSNVFSKLPAEEGILVRIDDKLKRIKNNQGYPGDNDVKDLAGYLILLMVLKELQ